MEKQNYSKLTNELYAQLTALHYMGLSTQSYKTYVKYGNEVTKWIVEHKLEILDYIGSWVDYQWNTPDSIWLTFFELFNEGEELEALRILSIRGLE